jgi:hypothetical protein
MWNRTLFSVLYAAFGALMIMPLPVLAAAGAALEIDGLKCASEVKGASPCKVGDRVLAKVSKKNLHDWTDKEAGQTIGNLVLTLDGQLLVGRPASYDGRHLIFKLKRIPGDDENLKAWKSVLARTSLFSPNKMELAVALTDSLQRIAPRSIQLELVSSRRVWSAIVLYAFLIIAFIIFAWNSSIIRDTASRRRDGELPFSLARTQMAWWFFVVLGGFMYIWLVTGDYNTLTAGVLGLIGISSTTGLAAISIDTSKNGGKAVVIQKLKKETAVLFAQIKQLEEELRKAPPNASELHLERDQKLQRLNEIAAEQRSSSPMSIPINKIPFVSDLLQGDQGISFHRFQLVTWTIVLGAIFGYSVFNELRMPELDATLLGLMGVSSGTYVGFKFPVAGNG